jgi:HSP20 family protein
MEVIDNYQRIERQYGKFMGSFTIPTCIEPNKIHAELKDGLLTMTLLKQE